MKEYYNEIAEGYEELHRIEQINKIKLVLSSLNIPENSRVLDVGCGTGFFFEFLNLPIKNKIGVDPSQKLLDIANKKNNGTYFLMSAENLKFDDAEFDFVFSFTAIQNFLDIKQCLEEIKRVGSKSFVLTFLKKSEKAGLISELIHELFEIQRIIDEEKDFIFLCEKIDKSEK